LIQNAVCLKCRSLFDRTPQECPVCEHGIFVHFNANEDPNSICEELLFTATLVQMGFDQAKLNRSAVPPIPARMQKRERASRVAAGAGAK
jgi:hypothetical protein